MRATPASASAFPGSTEALANEIRDADESA
jgi:hypothetical protein